MKYEAEVSAAIARWGPRYGVIIPRALVHAELEQESRHGTHPDYIRGGGRVREPDGDYSYGPMMVKGLTARTVLGIANPETLRDPARGISAGVDYLARQLKAFPGDTAAAVSAYNAGPGHAHRDARGRFPNQRYVDRVFALWHEYAAVLLPLALMATAALLFLALGRRPRPA